VYSTYSIEAFVAILGGQLADGSTIFEFIFRSI